MISTAKATQTLAFEFGATSFTPASNYYIGLTTTAITIDENGKGVGFTEPTNTGYARISVANTTANWSVVNAEVKNIPQLAFPTFTSAPSLGSGTEAVGWFISEHENASATGDCAIYFGTFTTIDPDTQKSVPSPKPLVAESEIVIKAGGLSIKRANECDVA